MGLKRKRSSDYSFSSPSTSSTVSSASSPPPNPLFSHPIAQMELDFPASKPKVWMDDSGRTRKRWRDARPEESQIHETTIHKLFTAQKEHPNAEPVLSRDQTQNHLPVLPQRSTLHSFWRIQQPKPIFAVPNFLEKTPQSRCEDCDRDLVQTDAMDMDMFDELDGGGWACQSCRKNVCGLCAVNGEERRCLECVR